MPNLGRGKEALALLEQGLDIADELASKDPDDYLSREKVAELSLDAGNILRHSNLASSLQLYDHALARIHEVKPNEAMQFDSSELLSASSYAERWAGHPREAAQRIQHALQILSDLHRYPAGKVEPMSVEYHALQAQADQHAETGETAKAIEDYRDLLSKLMAWKPATNDDLRDAVCVSRTWTALALLLKKTGQYAEASALEARRAELWKGWGGRLPNEKTILSQATTQIESPHRSRPH